MTDHPATYRPLVLRKVKARDVDAIDKAARAAGRSRENYLCRLLEEHAAELRKVKP